MTSRVTLATARQVLTQERRDHGTLALLLVVPVVLLTMLRYVHNDVPQAFDHIGTPLFRTVPVHHDVPRDICGDAETSFASARVPDRPADLSCCLLHYRA